MKSIAIGSTTFPSQAAAMRAFREILNAGTAPRGLSCYEETMVRALFDLHPEKQEKVGPGVAAFEIGKAKHGTRCYYAVLSDGTKIDFSYEHAIRGKPKTH